MATAPAVPNFSQFNFEDGDTAAVITKQNGVNAALEAFGNQLAVMTNSINDDLETISGAYYGALDADPTEDPNGNPPDVGDRYFNTVLGVEKSFNGTAWQANEVGAHLADPDPHAQYEFRVMHNTTATRAPNANDDSAAGYAPRSTWFDTSLTPPEAYRCISAAEGAAQWVKTSLTLDELGSAAAENAADLRDRGTHTGTQPLSTISDAGTAAAKNTGTGAGDVPTIAEADARYLRLNESQYLGTAIGDTIALPTHLAGISLPPTDNPLFRYVLLTAGVSGAGGYNEGVLISESVSGSAPLVVATAEIADPASPLVGQSINLWNTEGRFSRAGEISGVLEFDQMQRIFGRAGKFLRGPASSNGALRTINVTEEGFGGSTTRNFGDVEFDSANSSNSRTSSNTDGETRVKNESRVYLMRIR